MEEEEEEEEQLNCCSGWGLSGKQQQQQSGFKWIKKERKGRIEVVMYINDKMASCTVYSSGGTIGQKNWEMEAAAPQRASKRKIISGAKKNGTTKVYARRREDHFKSPGVLSFSLLHL